MFRVIQSGLLTTLQDGGRPGSAHLGIGVSGAADMPACRLANALVGNRADACVLEMTLQGPVLETDTDAWIALTGAPLPRARLNDAPLPMWQPVHVEAGSRLALGSMPHGCRSYLAIGGGIDVPMWRGSRATDVNAALGPCPHPLASGDTLPVGAASQTLKTDDDWSLDPRPWFDVSGIRIVDLLPASHTDQLDASSRDALTRATYTIGNDSNRVGVRLQGPALALSDSLELISEGVTTGTVQLPPGGQPIIMGPEHPVTGGYPRIAQVTAVDLPKLAQCRPSDTVSFRFTDMSRAMTQLAKRETALQQLIDHIGQRLKTS